MKRTFALLALLIAGFTGAFAQSMLKVSLADNSRFSIMLNGRYFNKRGQSITVGDLPPGRQHLKILRVYRNRWGEPAEEIVYQGRVNTYDGMITRFVYDPYTRMVDVQEANMQSSDPHYQPEARPQDNDNSDYNTQQQAPPSDMPVASPAGDKTGTLTTEKLQRLKTKADGKATDTEKMKVLKNGLRDEQLTTYNVSEIMDLFIFESSKVEFATWAYNMTVDNERYHDLDARLKTDGARQDLDNFIKSKN